MLEFLNPNLSSLIAAFFVAAARTFYTGALSAMSPAATTLISLSVSIVIAWAYYHASGGVEDWPIQGLLWFAAVGVVGSMGARYVSFISIKLVGLARGSIIVQTSLIWSTAMAVFIIGERITLGVGLGGLSIMLGSIFMVSENTPIRKAIPVHYYLAPLITAFFLALSHVFLRLGFFWIPSAPLSIGISSSTAFFLILLAMPFISGETPRSWQRRPVLIVLLGGISNAIAAIFFQTAMKDGKMIEVLPINRLSVLIIIFFSWLFFRKQEAVTPRVVLGGLMSVLGAWAIVSK